MGDIIRASFVTGLGEGGPSMTGGELGSLGGGGGSGLFVSDIGERGCSGEWVGFN